MLRLSCSSLTVCVPYMYTNSNYSSLAEFKLQVAVTDILPQEGQNWSQVGYGCKVISVFPCHCV